MRTEAGAILLRLCTTASVPLSREQRSDCRIRATMSSALPCLFPLPTETDLRLERAVRKLFDDKQLTSPIFRTQGELVVAQRKTVLASPIHFSWFHVAVVRGEDLLRISKRCRYHHASPDQRKMLSSVAILLVLGQTSPEGRMTLFISMYTLQLSCLAFVLGLRSRHN